MKSKFQLWPVFLITLYIIACKGNKPSPLAQEGAKDAASREVAFTEITFADADAIVRNYQDNFKTVLERNASETVNSEQTKHVWIDINELKAFIEVLEQEASSKKFNNAQLTGIRLYFAAYLKDGNIHQRADHAKRMTLVGCGTYRDPNTGWHRDLIIDGVSNPSIKAVILGYQNHGHLCPPEADEYCKGAGLGHP